MRVYRVTTTKGDVWESVASNVQAAIEAACKCFLCPESAIDRVAVVSDHSGPKCSGFYWAFTLTQFGTPLEGSPTILWYCAERNDVTLIGYDVSLPYRPEAYELLSLIEYK